MPVGHHPDSMAPMDTGFLKPFVVAAIRTLHEFCGIDATLKAVVATTIDSPRYPVDIAGVIGITGKTFRGAMAISFPKETFLFVMNKMLKENHTELTQDLEDGAAEFSNVIFGQAKAVLNQAGQQIKMAIPSVIKGMELESGCPTSTNGDLVILMTEAGPLYIEFAGEDVEHQAHHPAPTGAAVPKLDAHVLMSFVEGIRKTMETQCFVHPAAGTPFFKKPDSDFRFEVGGLVGVTGAAFSGAFSICFEKSVFLLLVENMTGEKCTEVTREIEDAAAELVNIVFGSAKHVLNAEGYALRTAIPTIIRGKNVQSIYPSQRQPIVVPFSLGGGQFWVEFAFEAVQH